MDQTAIDPQQKTQESQKKRKYTRKKVEGKILKGSQEQPIEIHQDDHAEMNSDLIHYTFKLEFELASAKKKLKAQRKQYRNLLHSLSMNFDSKGIRPQMIDEYLRSVELQHDSDTESDFNKLFTTCKYQITESQKPVEPDQPYHSENKIPLKKSSESIVTLSSQEGKESTQPKEKMPKKKKEKVETTTDPEGTKKKKKKRKESVEENSVSTVATKTDEVQDINVIREQGSQTAEKVKPTDNLAQTKLANEQFNNDLIKNNPYMNQAHMQNLNAFHNDAYAKIFQELLKASAGGQPNFMNYFAGNLK